jgi:TolA-binding protein
MSPQELQNQIEALQKQVKELERSAIQAQMDATILLYLNKVVDGRVTIANALLPTQTYSALSPSGTAPTGSIWMKDTGVLATREIHMYSGSAWVQFQ